MKHVKPRTLCAISTALVILLVVAQTTVRSSSPDVVSPDVAQLPSSVNRAGRIMRHGATKADAASSPSFANAFAVLQPALQTSTPRTNGKIAFASDRNNGNFEIYVTSATGGDATRLTNNAAEDFDPAWSPDGGKIAFVSDRNGTHLHIYVMNADGSDVKQITTDAIDHYDPAWSPDGTKIVYAGAVGDTGEIYVINAGGGSPARLTTDGADDAFPAWSPDGQQIVFSSNRDGLADDNYEIYSIGAGGGTPKRLTSAPSDDAYPAWSPDGKQIAFVSDRNDQNYEIFLMNAADGSGVTRLTTNSKEDVAPAWSPDGTKIVFMVGDFNPVSQDIVNSDIYTISKDGGGRTNISNNPADDVLPDWQAVVAATPAPTPTPAPSSVQFSGANYSVKEGDGRITLTVTRTGDASGAASVYYATVPDAAILRCDVVNGLASSRCDYITALGIIKFAPAQASATISVPVTNDVYAEGDEKLTVSLSDPSGINLGAQSSATVTIQDDEAASSANNPIDTLSFFVRQQYLDFLAREPEQGGFDGWMAKLNQCPPSELGNRNYSQDCTRIDVSASFFRSTEFQFKGYYVYRFYSISFGRRPQYQEFVSDTARVKGATDQEFEANRAAFPGEWVQRSAFKSRYDALGDAAFVDTLLQTAGLTTALAARRAGWVNDLQAGAKTRAQVLREIVESAEAEARFYNEAFVAMQYFGYLRRDPDAAGFDGWLTHLNRTSNYREMVWGFLYSPEYKLRFGPVPGF